MNWTHLLAAVLGWIIISELLAIWSRAQARTYSLTCRCGWRHEWHLFGWLAARKARAHAKRCPEKKMNVGIKLEM